MAAPSLRIELEGVTELQRALKVLSDPDLPFLRPALERSGQLLAAEGARRAGKIGGAVDFDGLKGKTVGTVRAVVRVKHPAGTSFEFGRTHYYRGYKGRDQRSGQKVKVAGGMKPRPFLGIKYERASGAIAATREPIEGMLSAAFSAEWDRIGAGG